jgi:predicted enzyme related to lactoylglutathione lyase
MPRPVHFEIQAADPKRAIGFYTALFGWTFNKWEGPQDYWLIKTGEANTRGIDGGLLPRRGTGAGGDAGGQRIRVHHARCRSRRVRAARRRAWRRNRGAENGDPTVGWLAYATDTEGNIFGMMQMDSAAK